MNPCLVCLQPLGMADLPDYHTRCAKALFGKAGVPVLAIDKASLKDMAAKLLSARSAVTGVQAKLSLQLEKVGNSQRLTVLEAGGRYILKPQTPHFAQLPENEHLTMLLAKPMGLPTAQFGLVKLADQSLAYLTLRMDRTPAGQKLDMEDLAQVTETPTDQKYRSSIEKVAKAIAAYSAVPGQDKLNLYLLLLHNFLTGNADMHLKNFSVLETPLGLRMAPAYDLVNTRLAMPSDKEVFAMPLRGKKSKFKPDDLLTYLPTEVLGLPPKVAAVAQRKVQAALPQWPGLIAASFLSEERKEAYLELLQARTAELGWSL